MRISPEGRIAILLALMGLGGVGIPMVAPSQPELGWIFIGVAALGFLAMAAHHARSSGSTEQKPGHARKMIAFYGMIASAIGLIGFAAAYFRPAHKEVSAPPSPTQASAPQPSARFGLSSANEWRDIDKDKEGKLLVRFRIIGTSAITNTYKASAYSKPTTPFSLEQEKVTMQRAVAELDAIFVSSPTLYLPRDTVIFEFDFPALDSRNFEDVKNGARLYLFMAIAYEDDNTPDGSQAISERCVYFERDLSQPVSCLLSPRVYYRPKPLAGSDVSLAPLTAR